MSEALGNEHSDKPLERARFVEHIYQSALNQNAQFGTFPPEKIRATIDSCLTEIEALESVAGSSKALKALTPDIARNVVALWDFSGSGNYDQARGDDAYKDLDWAEWSDKERLNYSAWLARKMAQMLDPGAASTPAKDSISTFGPTIIYNATEEMNAVARNVLDREGIIIPKEKVFIAEEGIKKTFEQIEKFVLPSTLHQPGKEIGIVSHAPHLMRIAHMFNKYKPLPSDMRIRFFPLRAPGTARDRQEYVTMEICGLLFYTYIASSATEEPCEYVIHGQQ